MLGPLSVICLAVMALLLLVRSLVVRHELGACGSQATLRSVNALRERRGL
jgi:hypothetical protein